MIELKNVNKWYGDYHALVDVNETIPTGEVVVVCGPSGSGKSTLIRTINRLEEIQGGNIILDGQDVHDPKLDVNQLRAGIGFVFQQFNLFPHLTVLENCTLAAVQLKKLSAAEAKERAMALLQRVGLANKADAIPSQLSGGQQQRVAIARALTLRPPIMLLDEPTSALDLRWQLHVLQAVVTLAQRRGLVAMVALHDLNLALRFCQQALVLGSGRAQAVGAPSDVLTSELIARVWGVQATLEHSVNGRPILMAEAALPTDLDLNR